MPAPLATFRRHAVPGLLVYYAAVAGAVASYRHGGLLAAMGGFLVFGAVTSIVVAIDLTRRG